MGTPTYKALEGDVTTAQIQDWIVKLVRDLNFDLTNIDTQNVNRLDAKVIIAQTITALQIAAGTITSDKIAAHTITANQIAADTITSNEIAANAITASEIAANAVTAIKIFVSQLSAISADLGTVNAGSITSNTTVNIGTNATIGKKLFLPQADFLNGIYWGSSTMQIYIDPAANALHIEASGGVYANSKRIDI